MRATPELLVQLGARFLLGLDRQELPNLLLGLLEGHDVRLEVLARPVGRGEVLVGLPKEVLAVLQAAAQALPEELRAARWLLKEREDFLGRVQAEGDQIIATSRAQAEQMVTRTELVKTAEEKARQIVADAEEQARHLKLETEDWCDQKLGAMEIVLQRTMKTVASGRSRLQGAEQRSQEPEAPPVEDEPVEGFFDQDEG